MVAFLQIATGPVKSRTVTVAEQVAVLPDASVAVSTTVFSPNCAQVNVAGETASVNEQLSVVPLLIIIVVTEAEPVFGMLTMAFLHKATGAIGSVTVTMAEQVAWLPEPSMAKDHFKSA